MLNYASYPNHDAKPNTNKSTKLNKQTNKQTNNQQLPVPINMGVKLFIAIDISKFEPRHPPQNKKKKKTNKQEINNGLYQ